MSGRFPLVDQRARDPVGRPAQRAHAELRLSAQRGLVAPVPGDVERAAPLAVACAEGRVIGLVGCSAQKQDRPAPARLLYCSPLFKKSLAFAESRCERVYILSAALGLVELEAVLAPYNRRLGGKAERVAWGRRVAHDLIDRHGRAVDYLILAGQDYAGALALGLRTIDGFRDGAWRGVAAARIRQPLIGLCVGQRLRRLNEMIGEVRA